MEVGKRYLIDDKRSLREWEVLEVAENAIKVQDKVETTGNSFFVPLTTINIPHWVLKSDIDKLGNTKFRILEELK